jgi:hypothetical protein
MDLSRQPVRAVTKESQTNHKRGKRTARQRGDIPAKARAEAHKRSAGRCEWCGWVNGSYDPTGRKWGLQAAHLVRRWNIDERTTETDIAMFCGPSVNTDTCHNKVDYTKAGKEWATGYRNQLIQRERESG